MHRHDPRRRAIRGPLWLADPGPSPTSSGEVLVILAAEGPRMSVAGVLLACLSRSTNCAGECHFSDGLREWMIADSHCLRLEA